MKIYNLFYIGLFIIMLGGSLVACQKEVKDSLSGRDVLAARLVLADSLYHLTEIPDGSSADIYLYPSDVETGYLYKKKADPTGNFLLDFLDKDALYRLTARLTTEQADYIVDTIFRPADFINNIRTFDTIPHVRDSIGFVLRPDYTKYDYLRVLTLDSVKQEILTEVDVCFFTSFIQFNSKDCAQAAFKTVTGAQGDAILRNAAPGRYYVFARKILGTDTLTATIADYVISGGGFPKLTLLLQ